jgi:hypothetical protein
MQITVNYSTIFFEADQAAEGTGHLSTKITCYHLHLSTLCGAPKRLIMVESGILFFSIFPSVPNFQFLTTDFEFILQWIVGIKESSWH